jgi:hypothetical protein
MLNEAEKAKEAQSGKRSPFTEIEQSLRHILDYLLTQQEADLRILPSVLTNLLILEALDKEEILKVYARVSKLLENTQSASLVLRLSMVLYWISFKVIKSHSDSQLLFRLRQLMRASLSKQKY